MVERRAATPSRASSSAKGSGVPVPRHPAPGTPRPAHPMGLHLRRDLPGRGQVGRTGDALLRHGRDAGASPRDQRRGRAGRPRHPNPRPGRLASLEQTNRAGQHHPPAAALQHLESCHSIACGLEQNGPCRPHRHGNASTSETAKMAGKRGRLDCKRGACNPSPADIVHREALIADEAGEVFERGPSCRQTRPPKARPVRMPEGRGRTIDFLVDSFLGKPGWM
jgi:hypothetical protein